MGGEGATGSHTGLGIAESRGAVHSLHPPILRPLSLLQVPTPITQMEISVKRVRLPLPHIPSLKLALDSVGELGLSDLIRSCS